MQLTMQTVDGNMGTDQSREAHEAQKLQDQSSWANFKIILTFDELLI